MTHGARSAQSLTQVSYAHGDATAIDTYWRPGRVVLGLILAGTLVRLALALALGLGTDESYMVAAGRAWRVGYFDHPPLSWWLSHGAAELIGHEAGWVVRLPFILVFAVSTWLMYRLGAALFGPRAGMWAALGLTLSPVFSVTTGGWVLPDGPLDCALLAAAVSLVFALDGDGGAWRWWLATGAAGGCALLSKYTAVLAVAGAAIYLLSQPDHRRWLARPQPYAAALVMAALFAPVVLWNARHGWASLAFQGARAGGQHWNALRPLAVLGGEALFVLPWLWLPLLVGAARALRAGPRAWQGWLLCCLGGGPVLLFAVVGLWSRHVLYHWAAPGYLLLFPLLGREIERWHAAWPRAVRRTLVGTAAALVAALAVLGSEVRWNWLPLSAVVHGDDPALQALDWSGVGAALAARGLLYRPDTVIAATGWQEAGKLGYAIGPDAPVVCLNVDPREFGLTSNAALRDGMDALVLSARPVILHELENEGFVFARLDELAPVELAMPHRAPLRLRVFLAHGLRRPSA